MPQGHEPGDAGLNTRDFRRLTDIVMGEAVVTLLERTPQINAETVAQRLREMAVNEPDANRRDAIIFALGVIQAEFTQSREKRDALSLSIVSSVNRDDESRIDPKEHFSELEVAGRPQDAATGW